MGRRAKNKQSAPEPLDAKPTPSSKKLGKRKADSDDLDGKQSQRPSKKVKDGQGNPKPKTKGTSKLTKGSKKKGNSVSFDDQDSGDGWEDVDDDVDLKTHVKFVVPAIFFFGLSLNGLLGLCSTTVTKIQTLISIWTNLTWIMSSATYFFLYP